MDANNKTLYLRLKRRISIRQQDCVKLSDAAHILVDDKEIDGQLSELILYKHNVKDGNRVVIDLLQIIAIVKKRWPTMSIDVYGDPQVLVMVSSDEKKPNYILLVVCWLLLFFGSGLALMNFHSDVNMKDTHIRIVELITGKHEDHPLWFQIPYSIGVGAGMILFFNHIFRKKFNEEPNPLEVEMYMYQENVNTYVIAEEIRNRQDKQKHSVGEEGYD